MIDVLCCLVVKTAYAHPLTILCNFYALRAREEKREQSARGKEGIGLRKSPGRGTTHSKTDVAVAILGEGVVAVSGAAKLWIAEPGPATYHPT